MTRGDGRSETTYAAFISYCHVDRAAARWLHRAIETYRIPGRLRHRASDNRPGRERLSPIFLDREELPTSSDLAESVRKALQASDFLVVVCSPASARSRWVNEEVRLFKAMGRSDRILCLIVAGEPRAADRGFDPSLECLPPALRLEVQNGEVTERPAAEPLAADMRIGADARRDARLKIVAGMLGVGLDELRQRDQARRQKRLAAIGVATTVGCIVLGGLAIVAWLARNEAEAQRRIAEQKSRTAERTASFMISLFQVADPSEARGNTVTVREILDRGVEQIDGSLRDEPLVRAELTTTLGEVYTGLGLYTPAFDLVNKARAVPGQPAEASLHQTVSLAELEFQRGNDRRADELGAQAEETMRKHPRTVDPALRARLLLARGDVAAVLERDADAQRYFGDALTIGRRDDIPEVVPRALEGLGLSSYYAGDLATAEHWYDQALAARVAQSGESHPRASETLNALGSIAYMRGDGNLAENYWQRSLAIDKRVLGDTHPNLAMTLNNLGRLRLEKREFAAARNYLSNATQIYAAGPSEIHEGQIFALTNLALADIGLGDDAAAEKLLQRALRAAVATKHRLEGPILTDLADLECHTGRVPAGLSRLDAARPIVADRYPDDAWRIALVDNVRAGCLAADGRARDAEPLLAASLPALLEKWPVDTYYGHDALERATHIYTETGEHAKLAALQRSTRAR